MSLETLEAASQTEEDVTCQTLLWEVMEEQRLPAAAAGEHLEKTLETMQRDNAAALIALDGPLRSVHEKVAELASSVRGAEAALVKQAPMVAEGEGHIRAIRGHEAQRERAERHLNELIEVLQLLMSSLSVPPRYLALLREPSFGVDDPQDMVAALRAVDKVVTLKDLDQRLLRMRAVSDRAQEYRMLMTSFSEALSAHVGSVLRDRAALRPPQAGTAPPTPYHAHLLPFTPLFAALPRQSTLTLLDSYMDLAKGVYKNDLPAFFSSLLNTVRRSKQELSVLEAFHLALNAVWGLIQSELEFWSGLLGEVGALESGNPRLILHLNNTFVELSEELGSFVDYADRHSALDVIGMMVEAAAWRSAGEPMQSLSAIVAISSRLTSMAQRHIQKISENAATYLRESHMSRGKTGPLTSFTKLPAFLDNIHSYGTASRAVTAEIVDKVLPAMLEWLESPEVVKELIKFDGSKKTIFAGRLENYHYLYTQLAARFQQVAYLEPYATTCRERFEKNLSAFVTYVFERECQSLNEYFGAISKMQRTVPAAEIQFQPALSRGAFMALNKRYNDAAWEKKVAHIRKILSKNIAPALQGLVFQTIKDFVLNRMKEYQETLVACYGPTTTFATGNVERFFE